MPKYILGKRKLEIIEKIIERTDAEIPEHAIGKALSVYNYFMEALENGAEVIIKRDSHSEEVVFNAGLVVTRVEEESDGESK